MTPHCSRMDAHSPHEWIGALLADAPDNATAGNGGEPA